uniref:Putative inorganic phosphate cotransporter n=1 Tax=Clastoptera arizonana TaxID=38151 RepID=A0A1B6CEG3_9HEMI
MTFLSLTVAYAQRVNLSVAIVAMTDNSTGNPNFPTVGWDSAKKGTILSSYFWGYIIMQVPAGQLARRLGPKYLLCGSTMICGILTILSPIFALHFNWLGFCFTRVLQGLSQGFICPSINTHMAKWAPPLERSRIFSFVFCGSQFGTVLTLFVAGLLAASPGGWPSIFYVTGCSSVLWSVVWYLIGFDSPASHSHISDEEKNYIEKSLIDSSPESKTMRTPWKDVVTSVPLWALLLTQCGQNWGFWTLLTLMPTYMSKILHFDIASNGFLSSLPYFCTWILTIVFSWASDYINAKQFVSLSVARKMWNTLAHWGGALALLILALTNPGVVMAVMLLTIAVGINAGTYMGYLTNSLDLAPNFAGLLMGITNGFSNITSIIGPIVAGVIVYDEEDVSLWKIVFGLSSLIFFLGNLIFIVFGTAEVQHWNQPKSMNS